MSVVSNNQATVLILEDEEPIRIMLEEYFMAEGYKVLTARSAEKAYDLLKIHEVWLILVDIQLPGDDGLTFTRKVRSNSDVGIIMITKKDSTLDRIIGLEMGADSYLVKPLEIREVLVYSKNLISRVKKGYIADKNKESGDEKSNCIIFDHWCLLINERKLVSQSTEEEVTLTKGEFHLLISFLHRPKTVLSRDFLLNKVKGRHWISNDRAIDILVAQLRKKLRDNQDEPQFIMSVYGEGYIFKIKPVK